MPGAVLRQGGSSSSGSLTKQRGGDRREEGGEKSYRLCCFPIHPLLIHPSTPSYPATTDALRLGVEKSDRTAASLASEDSPAAFQTVS